MKCFTCKIDMVQQGTYGPKGGFYPFRKPTVYKCPKCNSSIKLRFIGCVGRLDSRKPVVLINKEVKK